MNPSSGRSRNAPAISSKAESVTSADPVCSEPASIWSMAWSSCSMSACSAMGALHLSPQALYCAELKLFHRSFAPPELLGDLPDAFLLDEAHVDHPELRFRKAVHQLEQQGAVFGIGGNGGLGLLRRIADLPVLTSSSSPPRRARRFPSTTRQRASPATQTFGFLRELRERHRLSDLQPGDGRRPAGRRRHTRDRSSARTGRQSGMGRAGRPRLASFRHSPYSWVFRASPR